jgi:hypothetical protein
LTLILVLADVRQSFLRPPADQRRHLTASQQQEKTIVVNVRTTDYWSTSYEGLSVSKGSRTTLRRGEWMAAGMVKNAVPLHDWIRKIENERTPNTTTTTKVCHSANLAPGRLFRAASTARNMSPMVSLGYSASETIARIGLAEL